MKTILALIKKQVRLALITNSNIFKIFTFKPIKPQETLFSTYPLYQLIFKKNLGSKFWYYCYPKELKEVLPCQRLNQKFQMTLKKY